MPRNYKSFCDFFSSYPKEVYETMDGKTFLIMGKFYELVVAEDKTISMRELIDIRPCECGSLLPQEQVKDCMDIFMCYACPKCMTEKLSKFDPSCFDSQEYRRRAAEYGEAIEPEEW